jgi:hypothetical protein
VFTIFLYDPPFGRNTVDRTDRSIPFTIGVLTLSHCLSSPREFLWLHAEYQIGARVWKCIRKKQTQSLPHIEKTLFSFSLIYRMFLLRGGAGLIIDHAVITRWIWNLAILCGLQHWQGACVPVSSHFLQSRVPVCPFQAISFSVGCLCARFKPFPTV